MKAPDTCRYLSGKGAADALGLCPSAITNAYQRGVLKPDAYAWTGTRALPLFLPETVNAYGRRNA